ncbi:hypothetical protein FOQG_18691 [Fusarium oxysporum f. sp. raphani 54005]|uniref:Uncharacterized protein n=2 Tax=Fusarium oxysporum TaxID=5507 RepID=W9HGB1_FUSOX|nr:hypothetical protein FOYG_16831 [Fusarium oxysporum NRRL 32931]EXK76571.1 hypothetical protein FOQG_18691 [Fusarium oxysporum f. sp. raphani 54005]
MAYGWLKMTMINVDEAQVQIGDDPVYPSLWQTTLRAYDERKHLSKFLSLGHGNW